MSATLTKKTLATAFNQEIHPTAEPRSGEANDNLANLSTTSNPSKEETRSSIFKIIKAHFFNKQVFLLDGELVASPSSDKTAVRL